MRGEGGFPQRPEPADRGQKGKATHHQKLPTVFPTASQVHPSIIPDEETASASVDSCIICLQFCSTAVLQAYIWRPELSSCRTIIAVVL